METTINKRITILVDKLGKNTNSFAKSIDKSFTSIDSICKGKTNPGYELLKAILEKYPNVNTEWLMKGEGEMFRIQFATGNSVVERGNQYLLDHLTQIEWYMQQLNQKDRQIENLQKTVDTLLGKSEGISYDRLETFNRFFDTTNTNWGVPIALKQ